MASIFFTERLLALPISSQRPMRAHAVVFGAVMHLFSGGQKSRDTLIFASRHHRSKRLSQSRVCANSQERAIFKRYQTIKAGPACNSSGPEGLSDYKLGNKFIFCAVARL
jgi:hypothetical protein